MGAAAAAAAALGQRKTREKTRRQLSESQRVISGASGGSVVRKEGGKRPLLLAQGRTGREEAAGEAVPEGGGTGRGSPRGTGPEPPVPICVGVVITAVCIGTCSERKASVGLTRVKIPVKPAGFAPRVSLSAREVAV